MKFSEIIGQEHLKEHLSGAIERQKVSHAYIISGEPGSGKKTLAEAFAANLLCQNRHGDACGQCTSCHKLMHHNHPDLIYVTHEKTQITVDDIRRQVAGDVEIRPYESERKIYLIDEAEKMNREAQNALLKTIEEPPDYAVLILLTANTGSLLPTILSRCITLNICPLTDEQIIRELKIRCGLTEEEAEVYASFAQGNLGRALKAASDPEFRRRRNHAVGLLQNLSGAPMYELIEQARALVKEADEDGTLDEYLDLFVLWYRDVLLYKATADESLLGFSDVSYLVRRSAGDVSYSGLNTIFQAISSARDAISSNVREDLVIEQLFTVIKES